MFVFHIYQKFHLIVLCISIVYILECLCQANKDDVRQTSGYIGEEVVLKLDVDPTWKLRLIRWSMFENNTAIITFRPDQETNALSIIRDEFVLNTTTGDLTIKKLKPEHALKYRVELQNEDSTRRIIYIKLSVQEKVSKPNITVHTCALDSGECFILLKCSSSSSKVSLNLTAEPGFPEDFYTNSPKSVMWTILTTNRDVSFSCIASDGTHNESSKWTGKCQDSVQNLNCSKNTSKCHVGPEKDEQSPSIGGVLGGLFVGLAVFIFGVAFVRWWPQYFRNCSTQKDESNVQNNHEGETTRNRLAKKSDDPPSPLNDTLL